MGELKQIFNDTATASKQNKKFGRLAKKDLVSLKKQMGILVSFVDSSILQSAPA